MTFNSTRLSVDTVEAYARLRAQVLGLGQEDVASRCDTYRKRLEEGEDSFGQRVHVIAPDGSSIALVAAMAFPFSGPPWQAIVDWSISPDHEQDVVSSMSLLLDHWVKDLAQQEEPPQALQWRMNLDRASDALVDLVVSAGWQKKGERREFKTPVEALPLNWQGPLVWKDLDAVGLDVAAEVFELAGQGPDWEEDDNGRALIQEYLSQDDLFCEPSCVEVGYLDEEPVAFLVAQTAPGDGWCTITFMGVTAAARGEGLGQWVHRRGFELMRRQGGKLYHGGTSASNDAMLALFARHECVPFAHLAEWRLDFK